MAANKHYQQLKNHYYSLGQSAETKAAINTLANNQFKQTAGKILGDLIEKAGGKMISRQQAKRWATRLRSCSKVRSLLKH